MSTFILAVFECADIQLICPSYPQDIVHALVSAQHCSGQDWLARCMQAMAMVEPKAVVWQRLRALRRS